MGRGWHGTGVHMGPELGPCCPVGMVEEAVVGAAPIGEWWGAGSYRGHQASPSLLDAGVKLCSVPPAALAG